MVNPLAGLLVPFAWAAFAGAVLLTVALGSILAYHWFRYAMNPAMAFTATVAYASVAGILLLSALGATVAIQVAY